MREARGIIEQRTDSTSLSESGERNIVDYIAILWKRRILVLIIMAVSLIASVIIAFLIPPSFLSTATILPITQDSNSVFSQYAGLATLAGISLPSSGATTPSKKIVAILKSRTLCEGVVNELNLVPVLVKSPENIKDRDPFGIAVEKMQKSILSVAEETKTGIITVKVEYTDPQLAQKMASSAVSILEKILNEKSLTVSRKSNQMLEEQISEQGKKVSDLQTRMAGFQKSTKIISPEGQMTSAMTLYASLLEQKISLEVQLSRFENALASNNSLITTLQAQLDEIEKQIKNIESKTGVGSFSIGSAPEQIVEYQNIYRDLDIATKIYSALLATYENQKLSEAQDQLYIEVIDPPLVPEKKTKPNKTQILIGGVFAGILVCMVYVFLFSAIKKMWKDVKNKIIA